jgi:competence protein ComFC
VEILNFIFDLVFPKICLGCDYYSSSYICDKCLKKIKFADLPKCPICEKPTRFGESHKECRGRFGIDGMTVGVDYSDELVKKIIHKFKYGGVTNAARDLVEKFLGQKICRDVFCGVNLQGSTVSVAPIETIITFIPMHPDKERKRGYNQSEILAREIGEIVNLSVKKLLKRTKYTESQMSVKKMKDRKKNVEGIFRPSPLWGYGTASLIFDEMKVILIDDVATTGATLFEATRVLKENGVKSVWGMVLARRQ